jgi:hypothetical protein
LPPEWRLAFYNTAFSCVHLTYAEWAKRDVQVLAAWVEETLPHFRFVLEPNLAGTTPADAARLDVLAPRLGLLPGETRWHASRGHPPRGEVLRLEMFPDLRVLAGEVQRRASPECPVYLIGGPDELEELGRARILLGLLGM